MLHENVKEMNAYMNRVAKETFSYFDGGRKPSDETPEPFYHSFVLGLVVDLSGEYVVTSNRESDFGRYDVMIEPKDIKKMHLSLNLKCMMQKMKQPLLQKGFAKKISINTDLYLKGKYINWVKKKFGIRYSCSHTGIFCA